jgi:hypothetical protein
MYSKQYNRISLYDLIFYSKYKNYNRLLFKFKFIYELNSILHVIWLQTICKLCKLKFKIYKMKFIKI